MKTKEVTQEVRVKELEEMLMLAAYYCNDKCPEEFQGACPHKHVSCSDCWIDYWEREVRNK